MLVLTRKLRQGIVINGNIYICVVGYERGKVKLGISAPRDVQVIREEAADEALRAKQRA
jgi:carbon storage regulator